MKLRSTVTYHSTVGGTHTVCSGGLNIEWIHVNQMSTYCEHIANILQTYRKHIANNLYHTSSHNLSVGYTLGPDILVYDLICNMLSLSVIVRWC